MLKKNIIHPSLAGLLYWASEGYRAALTGGQASVPIHYIWHKHNILKIFSKYSLKIPQIYSNILEYTQIVPCSTGMKVYRAIHMGERSNNLDSQSATKLFNPFKPRYHETSRFWYMKSIIHHSKLKDFPRIPNQLVIAK
jgi:hypothetical protein